MMQTLAQWYLAGKVKPVIDKALPMAELMTAYDMLANRRIMGKVVMVNAGS